VLALSVSNGEELWRREYPVARSAMNRDNAYAAGTPAVDANGVYLALPTVEETLAMALGHDGRPIWTRKLPGVSSFHGPAISVVAVEGLVVFSLEQEAAATPSQWIALDASTGEPRWTCDRQSSQVSYSTPCVYTPPDGPAQLVFSSSAHGLTGVAVATGQVVWEAGAVLPQRVVGSPVIAGDLLIGTCGQGGGGVRLVAVRAGSGEVVYETRGLQAPYVPTPLAVGDLLFTCHDRGDISCLVAATGEVLWTQRPASMFHASPVWVDGKLYCTTRDGDVVVVRASRTYELLAVNRLGEASSATPAVAGGRMYLRTLSHLISVGGGT
jgi:outer membrane protein assembly factor BamB